MSSLRSRSRLRSRSSSMSRSRAMSMLRLRLRSILISRSIFDCFFNIVGDAEGSPPGHLDSSIRFINTGNFSHIKGQMLQTGGVLGMLKVTHSIFSATHPQLYDYFPSVMEKVKKPGSYLSQFSRNTSSYETVPSGTI